ncbi:MAG: UvrD-helicase domain-containing protein [Bacteroidales bacterium]|nr:UvrD-helicase domain-containing protein [Bacteroidales bacterium]
MENEGNKILEGLNEAQKEAVMCLTGPSLIVAGAGSGKTKVLTCKIANILSHGYKPYSVLALTFTNKAAREMKKRIADMVGEKSARMIYMGTFHSIFLRFLRQYAELLGFPPGFTIYDKDDSKSLIKKIIKEKQLDDKLYKPSEINSRISQCKNNFITPSDYNSHPELVESDKRSRRPAIAEIYASYQTRCKEQGVMDFDDILLNTYRLLASFPEAFAQIKAKFQFILIDEYQDTNYLQYVILRALAEDHQNITVVGDDAQSIYAFRGARIENILNFKKDYPKANVFRLERNYRSTQNIVNAANSLISKNKGRITKECYSKRDEGSKIELLQAYTEQEEGLMVASSIQHVKYSQKANYKDFAVLYRTNAQSRAIEEALRKKNIPYKIYAGHSFYERQEIKHMVAYLRLIVNPKDDESFKRCINYPSRGIGASTMERVIAFASEMKKPICEAVTTYTAEQFALQPSKLAALQDFTLKLAQLRDKVNELDAYQIATEMDRMFAITASLKTDTSLEGQSRLENVLEFFDSIKEFVDEGVEEFKQYSDDGEFGPEQVTLDLFLQNIALIADSDSPQESSEVNRPVSKEDEEKNEDRVSLMTVHSSKGLEFPFVYVVGMEENLFPSGSTSGATEKEIEEERRLFYVAVTRAENFVNLSFSRSRFRWGSYVNNPISRFIKEIDTKYIKNPEIVASEQSGSVFSSFGASGFSSFPHTEKRTVYYPGSSRSVASPFGSRTTASAERPSFTPASQLKPKKEDFVADAPTRMRVGQTVEHERFGKGKIITISGNASDLKAVVEFEEFGRKTLLLKFAKMKILQA